MQKDHNNYLFIQKVKPKQSYQMKKSLTFIDFCFLGFLFVSIFKDVCI